MGCGSSTEYQPGGLKAPSEGSSVEELLLQLWAERSKAGNIATIAEKLIAAAPSQMDQVELYLPQFAHIVANLADELAAADVTALERFLLFVSQLSIHMVRPPNNPAAPLAMHSLHPRPALSAGAAALLDVLRAPAGEPAEAKGCEASPRPIPALAPFPRRGSGSARGTDRAPRSSQATRPSTSGVHGCCCSWSSAWSTAGVSRRRACGDRGAGFFVERVVRAGNLLGLAAQEGERHVGFDAQVERALLPGAAAPSAAERARGERTGAPSVQSRAPTALTCGGHVAAHVAGEGPRALLLRLGGGSDA
eukprot:4191971-Prymnesium_polylepis.1